MLPELSSTKTASDCRNRGQNVGGTGVAVALAATEEAVDEATEKDTVGDGVAVASEVLGTFSKIDDDDDEATAVEPSASTVDEAVGAEDTAEDAGKVEEDSGGRTTDVDGRPMTVEDGAATELAGTDDVDSGTRQTYLARKVRWRTNGVVMLSRSRN